MWLCTQWLDRNAGEVYDTTRAMAMMSWVTKAWTAKDTKAGKDTKGAASNVECDDSGHRGARGAMNLFTDGCSRMGRG